MEDVTFEERNLLERRTFHRIQLQLRYCRAAILILMVLGLIEISLSLKNSYHKYMQLSENSRSVQVDAGVGVGVGAGRGEIRNEVYNIAVLCLFFVVNSFAALAVMTESFLLITGVTVFNVGILLLSFTADNSLPHGIIFKLILLFIIQLTVYFFLLMRSRRLS